MSGHQRSDADHEADLFNSPAMIQTIMLRANPEDPASLLRALEEVKRLITRIQEQPIDAELVAARFERERQLNQLHDRIVKSLNELVKAELADVRQHQDTRARHVHLRHWEHRILNAMRHKSFPRQKLCDVRESLIAMYHKEPASKEARDHMLTAEHSAFLLHNAFTWCEETFRIIEKLPERQKGAGPPQFRSSAYFARDAVLEHPPKHSSAHGSEPPNKKRRTENSPERDFSEFNRVDRSNKVQKEPQRTAKGAPRPDFEAASGKKREEIARYRPGGSRAQVNSGGPPQGVLGRADRGVPGLGRQPQGPESGFEQNNGGRPWGVLGGANRGVRGLGSQPQGSESGFGQNSDGPAMKHFFELLRLADFFTGTDEGPRDRYDAAPFVAPARHVMRQQRHR